MMPVAFGTHPPSVNSGQALRFTKPARRGVYAEAPLSRERGKSASWRMGVSGNPAHGSTGGTGDGFIYTRPYLRKL